MTFRPLILVAAAASALVSVPSLAAPSVAVQYNDLDLTSAHGKQVLQRRIDAAARSMCGVGEIRTGTILPSSAARKCYKQALADINEQFAMVVDKASTGG
jgi:UrcA family protein